MSTAPALVREVQAAGGHIAAGPGVARVTEKFGSLSPTNQSPSRLDQSWYWQDSFQLRSLGAG